MVLKEYKDIDGIKVFHDDIATNHADYKAEGLDNLHKVEEQHFWFLARKDFITTQMKKVVSMSSKIIEIGAGTGNVSRCLKRAGFSNMAVGEMHLNGLRYAQSYGIDECYQFDLLRAPFKDEFDTICIFDVLEHIDEDKDALVSIHSMLKNNGHIVLTVPSHQWLWNRDDVLAGHKKRYTRADLVKLLKESGFEIIIARYFFISIVPLLLLRKLLGGFNIVPKKQKHIAGIWINPVLSKILLYISIFENKLNKFLPNCIGGSLFVAARKA